MSNEIVVPAARSVTTMDPASPAMDQASLVLQAIINAAENPNINVDKMEALLGMQERLLKASAERQFNEAFMQLQTKLPRIKRDGSVLYENKKTHAMEKAFDFATWESIDEVIRPILHSLGFSLSFDTAPRAGDGGGVVVTGTLRHVGGHFITASIPVPLDTSGGKNSNQGYGSALSYGKRYTTTALLNLVFEGEDDDAQKAGLRFITTKQVAELALLLEETKTDTVAFCRHFDVADIANLPTSDFVPAVNMLNVKKARNK